MESVWRKMTQAPIFNLLNDLTEWDDTDHHHGYFNNESFDTKFKTFRNLGAVVMTRESVRP